MWQSHPLYWELWFVRAGELRSTYLGNNTRVPSFDQAATIDNDHDDNYGTGIILNKRDYPSGNKKGITKGWVRYLGTAGLYRVPDLQSVNANWLNQFQVYNSNQPTPAGTLPYIDTNPNFSPTAMEGREVIHNMVAYWNSCWPTYPGNKYTKVEPNPAQAYSDADLWAKVLARGPQQQATPALSGAKRKVPAAFLAPVHGYGTRSNSAANNKKQKTGHGAQVVSPASACSSAAQKNP